MAKNNFTITTVATAPSPATSGTSLVVAAGTGSLFALNEPAIIFPVNDQPLVANAEIVMVTNVATDTLTITRTQESTSARTIVEGDIIIQGITAKDWNDIVALIGKKANIVTGTSTTARTTAAKTVTISDYTLAAGDLLAITFTDGFSVANATLNINGVGAKNIRVGAVNVTTSLISVAAATSFVLPLYYDGTYFYAYGSSLNNTYTVPTEIPESEITAGTASTVRAITGRRAEFLAASIKSRSETLTNKTIDGDDNTLQDIALSSIKSTSKLGDGSAVLTTNDAAGTEGNLLDFGASNKVEDSGIGVTTSAGGISGSDSDSLIPTNAAIIDYVDAYFGSNSFQIDSSGGTSDTYGVLTGSVNGTNRDFTVSLGEYISGSLLVFKNGVLQTQGSSENWIELTPASGTFRINTAPLTGDVIDVYYKSVASTSGNADTLDGLHSSAFKSSSFVGCRVYSSANQDNLTDTQYTKVNLDTEGFDAGSNYDTTNKRFVAPISGYYQVNANLVYKDPVADKRVGGAIYINGSSHQVTLAHTSSTSYAYVSLSCVAYVVSGQYIELYAVVYAGANTVDLYGHGAFPDSTAMDITLLGA